MKYRTSLPAHNDNISHEHPLKDFVLILVGLSLAVLLALWALGLVVDRVVDRLSPETEAKLSALVAPPAPKAEAAMKEREAWAQSLVDQMRQCAGLRTPVLVRMTQSKQANAVVVPGGTVIVYSGLLGHLRSENGMAFVLAHELSHLAHRDHLRAIGRKVVLIAAAALLTGDGSGTASVLAPAEHLGESGYSRGREASADRQALEILQCRYGHVGGATEFFESLRHGKRDAPVLAHYLASHPSMTSRSGSAGDPPGRSAGGRRAPIAALGLSGRQSLSVAEIAISAACAAHVRLL
ncbi:M48 family metallopeptidase [Massilia consociata]|uniref:M48 family metallopeptidase n=1 Tax=Massilia consociata TaxID=760117 RepID=A0ABV6FJR5_9BURK